MCYKIFTIFPKKNFGGGGKTEKSQNVILSVMKWNLFSNLITVVTVCSVILQDLAPEASEFNRFHEILPCMEKIKFKKFNLKRNKSFKTNIFALSSLIKTNSSALNYSVFCIILDGDCSIRRTFNSSNIQFVEHLLI